MILLLNYQQFFFNKNYSTPEYKTSAQTIRDFYFPNGVHVNENFDSLTNFISMMSNVYENYEIDKRVKALASLSRGKTYYYRFDLDSKFNYYKILFGAQDQVGAAHADDLCYVFKCEYIEDRYNNVTDDEYNLLKTMTKLYTNFAKYGDPVYDWEDDIDYNPVKPGKIEFLDITNNGLIVDHDPFDEHHKFWDGLLLSNPGLLDNNVNKYLDCIVKSIGNKTELVVTDILEEASNIVNRLQHLFGLVHGLGKGVVKTVGKTVGKTLGKVGKVLPGLLHLF